MEEFKVPNKFSVGDRVSHLTRKPQTFGTVVGTSIDRLVIDWDDKHSSRLYTHDGRVFRDSDVRVALATPLEELL